MTHFISLPQTLVAQGYLARAWCTCPSHQEARKPTSRLWQLKYWIIFTPKIGVPMNPFLTHIFQMGWFNHNPETIRWVLVVNHPPAVAGFTSAENTSRRSPLLSRQGQIHGKSGSSKPISVWLMLFDSGSDISINDKFDKCHNLRTSHYDMKMLYIYNIQTM